MHLFLQLKNVNDFYDKTDGVFGKIFFIRMKNDISYLHKNNCPDIILTENESLSNQTNV